MKKIVLPSVLCVTIALTMPLVNKAWAAASCPVELGAIDDAKPNKLYLYFPMSDDSAFPATTCTPGTLSCWPKGLNDPNATVRPLKAFDVSSLSSYTGTVSDLRDAVRDVVVDDYCEFNVKVIETTSVPPTAFPRRVTVGIGADSATGNGNVFGTAQEVDIGDAVGIDFARVWAGSYQSAAGGPGGHSMVRNQRWSAGLSQ